MSWSLKLGGKASKVAETANKIVKQFQYLSGSEQSIVNAHVACLDAVAKEVEVTNPELVVTFESSGFQSGDILHAEMKLDRYAGL